PGMFKALTIHKNLTQILLLFFLITIPLKNSINSISIILLIIFSVINIRKISIDKLKTFRHFFLFYAFIVISLIYSVDLKEAGKYIILGLPLIIFPIVFSTIEI